MRPISRGYDKRRRPMSRGDQQGYENDEEKTAMSGGLREEESCDEHDVAKGDISAEGVREGEGLR